MSLPFGPLVTIVRAKRPGHEIERHVFVGVEPRSGQLSLCRDVQYSATLSDGLVPICSLCRSAGLGAVALTASALDLVGVEKLSLYAPAPDPEHDRKKAAIDAGWAPGELVEAYGR